MADLNLQRLAQASSIEEFEMFFKKQIRVGEERLVLAVLESAVDNYQKYVRTGDARFQEAEKWLFIEQDKINLRMRDATRLNDIFYRRLFGEPPLEYCVAGGS